MIKFPKILHYSSLVKTVSERSSFDGVGEDGTPRYKSVFTRPTLHFHGTVKLHGTNAGVCVMPDGDVIAQSRNRRLTADKDNYDFAAFALGDATGPGFWRGMTAELESNSKPITIYGEWVGSGIQHGAGICQLKDRRFVIFAIRRGDGEEGSNWLNVPSLSHLNEYGVYSITDFPAYSIGIDFDRPDLATPRLSELTLEVEASCPVAAAMGVAGTGEGIVWRCVTPGWDSSRYWFKTKGDKHSASKVKTVAASDPEKMSSVYSFVDRVVTANRLEQGVEWLREMGKPIDRSSTGEFLSWVFADIMAEEADSMAASGLEKKDVSKVIGRDARAWYFKMLDAL